MSQPISVQDTRFFVTLEEISNHLCLSEVWEITQFSRLQFGNLLISVFCRDMRIVRPLDAEPPACYNGSLSRQRYTEHARLQNF